MDEWLREIATTQGALFRAQALGYDDLAGELRRIFEEQVSEFRDFMNKPRLQGSD